MDFILIFVSAMFLIGAGLWALTTALKWLDPRVAQWPLLWATAIWLSVAIAVLGILLSLLPDAGAHDALSAFSLHEPLQSLGLMAGGAVEVQAGAKLVSFAQIKAWLAAFYLGGVFVRLIKLGWGRFRIHRLILKADCADIPGQDDVLISADVKSPFAWTPFGQPQHSRILLPQSYRGVVSAAQIQDILIHERAHITRRDDEVGLTLRVLLCLCWVSPFVKSLFGTWSQATEIRCDMAVTARRDPKMRKAYADTLVQALHIMAGRVQQYPAASFSTHRIRNEKMRIKHIMDGAQPTYKRGRDRAALGAMASILTALGMLTISATAGADPVGKPSKLNVVVTPMVTGKLTAKYGLSADPFDNGKMRNHFGIDIAAPMGTPIYAPADGVIRAATDVYNGNPKYGTVVVIETDGGVVTMFAHLEGCSVISGQRVTQGTQIGTIGSSGKSTGPHVHIETHKDGTRVDPQTIWEMESG